MLLLNYFIASAVITTYLCTLELANVTDIRLKPEMLSSSLHHHKHTNITRTPCHSDIGNCVHKFDDTVPAEQMLAISIFISLPTSTLK